MPDYGDERGFRSRPDISGVPQRVVQPPHLRHRMSNIERQIDTYGSGRAGDTPIQSGGAYGEFGSPPQQDRLYTGRNPFNTPHQGFSDQGQYAGQQGYFGGPHEEQHGIPTLYGGKASDMMEDYYRDQSGWADQLQSAIGGVGEVIPAGYTDPAAKPGGSLWVQANRNVNPDGMTPLPQIIQEWEKLKEVYWEMKAQGYSPGDYKD